ncbi:tetratricopeptide repeat protein [Haloferula sargassicola]|uniref:Tetratricopeptide repeat protein n=1 Tax=Haloferula sargassicola TaxID=490096 RepID=A0ABP9UL38_9BACT
MKTNPSILPSSSTSTLAAALVLASTAGVFQLRAQDEAAAMRERIAALEKRLSELESREAGEKARERLREQNKMSARKRAAEDRRRYKPEELAEIESLYQIANKKWRSDEARESLKKLLEKYHDANRTGCSLLYMGQMSKGKERVEYLTRAVEEFSDCFYLDGCQVGGYGRYVLAMTLWENGDKDRALALLAELKGRYKDAIDHMGRPMSAVAEAAEASIAAEP